MEKYYMTKEKLRDLRDRLNFLRSTGRDEIANLLHSSRKDGDYTAEDSTYGEILDRQRHIEDEILVISNQINNAVVIRSERSGAKRVDIGSEVIVEFNNKEDRLKIVGELEADPLQGKISNESPVGKALLGKSQGDEVDVETPVLTMRYKILEIL